jgi:hypothetical protein
MKSLKIELGTFRLVAECLNLLRYRVPQRKRKKKEEEEEEEEEEGRNDDA